MTNYEHTRNFLHKKGNYPVILVIEKEEYDPSQNPWVKTYPHKLFYVGDTNIAGTEDFVGSRCIVYTTPPWLTSYKWRPRLIEALEKAHKKYKGNPLKTFKKKKPIAKKKTIVERKSISATTPKKRISNKSRS